MRYGCWFDFKALLKGLMLLTMLPFLLNFICSQMTALYKQFNKLLQEQYMFVWIYVVHVNSIIY